MYNATFINKDQRKAKTFKTLKGAYKSIFNFLKQHQSDRQVHVILHGAEIGTENYAEFEAVPYTQPTQIDFYQSKAWFELRVNALITYDRACCLCGASGKGVQLHVDHIKPRSKYPHLALDLTNLQILCKACNIGKSNKHTDDWRE